KLQNFQRKITNVFKSSNMSVIDYYEQIQNTHNNECKAEVSSKASTQNHTPQKAACLRQPGKGLASNSNSNSNTDNVDHSDCHSDCHVDIDIDSKASCAKKKL